MFDIKQQSSKTSTAGTVGMYVQLFMLSFHILHCAVIYIFISKAWNLYASLCFESDGFGWNIKIPSSLRGERLSQIVPPFLWHCWLVAARVSVWDRPTATASCNSITVQHFRTSLLLLFTLSSFFSLYFLSLNGFYCIWLKWTFAVLSDFMS